MLSNPVFNDSLNFFVDYFRLVFFQALQLSDNIFAFE